MTRANKGLFTMYPQSQVLSCHLGEKEALVDLGIPAVKI